jgi:hypothetical protein
LSARSSGFSVSVIETFDPALHGGLVAVRRVHHADRCQSVERWVVSIRMRTEIGRHVGDRVRKVAGVEVFKRSFSTPVEMLVPRQWLSPQGSVRVLFAFDRRGLDGFAVVGEGLREAVAFEGGLLAIEAPAFDHFVGELVI